MASLLGRNALNITRMCSYRIAIPGNGGGEGWLAPRFPRGRTLAEEEGGGHNISLLYIPPKCVCVLQTLGRAGKKMMMMMM